MYYSAPEAFDVIESTISATQRKNLAEVAKTLHQVSIGKSVSGVEPHIADLNACIQVASKRFATYLNEGNHLVSLSDSVSKNCQ
jgi:hypothetical protein